MMYRMMDGSGKELTAREVAELAMPHVDDDDCSSLRYWFSAWVFDNGEVDMFDAVMGRLDPLDMMEMYVNYLGRTSDEELYEQFGVSVVREIREPKKDLPLRFDMSLDPKCLDGPCEILDYPPMADKEFGDGSEGE